MPYCLTQRKAPKPSEIPKLLKLLHGSHVLTAATRLLCPSLNYMVMLGVLLNVYRPNPGWFEDAWFNWLWRTFVAAIGLGLVLGAVTFIVSQA